MSSVAFTGIPMHFGIRNRAGAVVYPVRAMANSYGSQTTPAAFEEDVAEASAALRSAYAQLLAALPEPADRPVSIERQLNLNSKLAWQVHRVAFAPEPIAAGIGAPGPSAAKGVMKAAKAKGVPAEVVERIRQATNDFQETIQRHSDTRTNFDLMVRSITEDGLGSHELELKRVAYRANTELLGKTCDCSISLIVVLPGSRPGHAHVGVVRGHVGLYRLRPELRLQIGRTRIEDLERNALNFEPVEDEDPMSAVRGTSLLAEYCTKPLPRIVHEDSGDGFVRHYADSAGIGRATAITCLLWSRANDVPVQEGIFGHVVEMSTPSKLLLHDCVIHPDLANAVMPELRVLEKKDGPGVWPGENRSVVLPIEERVVSLGAGPGAAAVPEVSWYTAMLRDIGVRMGCDMSELVTYRARIEFPVLQSMVWMRFNLSGILRDLGERGSL